jgi:predicted CXXCH cytochrome family protein
VIALLLASLLAAPAAAPAPPAQEGGAYRLKPGARGKLCLSCHGDFGAKLERKYVHTPVKAGECIACHDPHASAHGKLLATEPDAVCASCHKSVVPADAKSVHKPVATGSCVGCHDPHSSDNPFVLAKPGAEACASCHKQIVEASTTVRFKHKPLQQGCATCHSAHASTRADSLLKAPQPQLCLDCHKASPALTRAHAGFPVAKASCTMCHDPHGSDRKGMLYASAHQPMATRMCTQCHQDPVAGKPVALKRQGAALCKECHGLRVTQMMEKARVHWPIADETSCLRCHDPHASKQPRLVAGRRMDALCATCHADTIGRQERSPTKHAPIRDGNCTACHDPHSSDNVLMLKEASINEGCGKCHDWQRHSTHPIGDQIKDPRNRNLRLNCLSCHRAHGTEYKNMLPYPTTTDLCTKCHEDFKR